MHFDVRLYGNPLVGEKKVENENQSVDMKIWNFIGETSIGEYDLLFPICFCFRT